LRATHNLLIRQFGSFFFTVLMTVNHALILGLPILVNFGFLCSHRLMKNKSPIFHKKIFYIHGRKATYHRTTSNS